MGARKRKSVKLTSVSVAERSEASTKDHEETAGNDGNTAAVVIGNIWRDEEGANRANVKHVNQNSELVGIGDIIAEVIVPELNLLGCVDQHAVVTRRGRCNHQRDAIQIELT